MKASKTQKTASKLKLTSELIQGFVESVLQQNFDTPAKTPSFHKELWELCCSDNRLVAAAAPRGHAKSTSVTHSYVLACVLFRQHDFVIIVSDTEGQARDFVGDIKKELQGNETLINLFKVKGFLKDTETDIIVQFEDGEEFRIIAKGSEQKVRGLKWKGKRPNLIVGDDLENDEIVMNSDRREKFRKWFMGALIPCLSPQGKIRIVGTILHLDSFLARICPQEGFKNTVVEPLKIWDSNPRTAWKAVVWKAHVGRKPSDITSNADILWPERFNREWFQENYRDKVQLGHPELYAQEMLNQPLDEATAFFRKHDFLPITAAEKQDMDNGKKPLSYYVGIDLAISEKERADYSVFQIVGVDDKNIMYHIDRVKERMDGREIIDTLFNLNTRYKPEFFAIEDEKITKSLGPFIHDEMLRRGEYFRLIPIKPSGDKPTRAKPLQGKLRIGGVKFNKEADFFEDMQAEFLAFPRGKHDDQVDAMAYIALALEKVQPSPSARELEDSLIEELEDENRTLGFGYGRSRITGY